MSEWWIEEGDIRLRVTTRGVLIGRSNECDIGVPDSRVSRRHLLVRLDGQTPVLEIMGRNGARVNGEAARPQETRPLAAGDRITIHSRAFRIRHTPDTAASASSSGFFLCHDDGLYGVNHVPFAVGSAAGDDLVIPAWPESALRILAVQDTLVTEV